MKNNNTYRFSLSWPMNTQEQITAGEFLNSLGNKKSRFIIELVCASLQNIPDAPKTQNAIPTSPPPVTLTIDDIRQIIRAELNAMHKTYNNSAISPRPKPPEEIGDMFSNLDVWR